MAYELSESPPKQPFLAVQEKPQDCGQYDPLPVTQGREKAKVAIRRNVPAFELLLHAISLTVILLIVVFNYKDLFWQEVAHAGGSPTFAELFNVSQNSGVKAWQFAAKAHELLMQGSMSALGLYYAHRLLTGPRVIPFALLSPPYNNGSPKILSSLRFWENSFKLRRQYLPFGLLLLAVCVLSVVLGPSSAVLMIPSLGWWPRSNPFDGRSMTIRFIYENPETSDVSFAASSQLWPPVFNDALMNDSYTPNCTVDPNAPNYGCPFQGYSDITTWFFGFVTTGASGNLTVSESLSNAQRSISSSLIQENLGFNGNEKSVVSSYTTSLSEVMVLTLGSLWNYIQRNQPDTVNKFSRPRFQLDHNINTYQPLVHIICQSQVANATQNMVKFPNLSNNWNPGSYLSQPYTMDPHSELLSGLPTADVRLSWFKDSRINASTSLLALAIVPVMVSNHTASNSTSLNSTGNAYQEFITVTCSIDARFTASEVVYQPQDSNSISSNFTDPYKISTDHKDNPEGVRARYGISKTPVDWI